jgi:hypothetical protein
MAALLGATNSPFEIDRKKINQRAAPKRAKLWQAALSPNSLILGKLK